MTVFALDYDGTYTRDPELWDSWIKLATSRGHLVLCVTMRYQEETIEMPCEVIYTSRKAKQPFMIARGFRPPDVWIDNEPKWLLEDSL